MKWQTCIYAILFSHFILPALVDDITNHGAKFRHRSEANKENSSAFYQLYYSIVNNNNSRLSVRWKDANIECTGFSQLDPSDSCISKLSTADPHKINTSVIDYGLGLQYHDNVEAYIDGQKANNSPGLAFQSNYGIFDRFGKAKFIVEIFSGLRDGVSDPKTTFNVQGGLSLILPPAFTHQHFSADRDAWEIKVVKNLSEIRGFNSQETTASEVWITNNMPRTEGDSLTLLINKRTEPNSITVYFEHFFREKQKVYIAALMKDDPGFWGVAANAYLSK